MKLFPESLPSLARGECKHVFMASTVDRNQRATAVQPSEMRQGVWKVHPRFQEAGG